jgi:hypothetical protein
VHGSEFYQSTVTEVKMLRVLTVDKIAEIVNSNDSDIDMIPESNSSESSSADNKNFSVMAYFKLLFM